MIRRSGILLAAFLAFAGSAYASDPGSGALEVSSQILKGESVIISRVLSPAAGWVSVHASEGGAPGRLLGYAPVRAGESSFVWIKLDLEAIAPGLVAVLRTDAGKPGIFEYPGPDSAVFSGGSDVTAAFNLVGCRGEISCDPQIPTSSSPSPWGGFGQ